jgi:alpha-D-ribose 1-methylphosphonate 5-triphosphate synthase subunit PhnG
MQSPDRSERFERIAACEADVLEGLADRVLADDPPFEVLQEPRPQLVMQRVREPVEHRPFNLGEVVVTPAEVRVDGDRGFAMVPGKDERGALSGAVVDAAVAADHPITPEAAAALAEATAEREAEREREWARSRHTTVEFEAMEDES